MFAVAFSFLAGNLLVHSLTELPGLICLAGLPILICLRSKRRWQYLAAISFLGFLWTWAGAYPHLQAIKEFTGGQFQVTIAVDSIPIRKSIYTQFIATVIQTDAQIPSRLRLAIYADDINLRRGDILEAKVRLKPVHGSMNPGGFDYEKHLFGQKIGATGYIKKWQFIRSTDSVLIRVRNFIYHRLLKQAQTSQHTGLIMALAMGERGYMTTANWDLLVTTGIGHLFAISGLHISLIFGIGFFLFRFLWRRYFLCRFGIPTNTVAAVLALPIALFYAWLAGFSIPTQRALIMLVCIVIGRLFMRRQSLSDTWAWALIIVLLIEPLSSLSIAFWFSFLAVGAIILYLNSYQTVTLRGLHSGLYLYIPCALFPIGLLFFGYAALLAPFANLLAIPYVSFILLPVCLLAALFAPVNEEICGLLVQGADFLFDLLTFCMYWLTKIEVLQWFHHPPLWVYIPAIVGAAGIVVLSGLRKKLVAVLLLLSLTVMPERQIGAGEFQANFLDVGQGLAVVVHTAEHTLLFDTGAKYPSGFDLGRMIVVPYLRWSNVPLVNTLVISHWDNDHAGGSHSILELFPVDERYSGGGISQETFRDCTRATRWNWDGVQFEFLHPTPGSTLRGNNASCVLRISNASHSLLLTSDIEAAAEDELIAHYGESLRTDVLLVPHHGSLTSSTLKFVQLSHPGIAIVSSGFRNRFGFPKQAVIERYQHLGSAIYNTADSGAIQLDFPVDDKIKVRQYRADKKRYWHHVSIQ